MNRPVEEQARVLYMLVPGYVTSKHDAQSHYIGSRELAHLYGVELSQCAILDTRAPSWSRDYQDNLILLRPRADGDYSVATVIQEMPWD